MLRKEEINQANFGDLLSATAVLREDTTKQDEALVDIRVLREFAIENTLMDGAVECFLEEALIWQHKYMETKKSEFLSQMERMVLETQEFVKTNDLSRWESRVARFLGRIADYQKKYSAAESFYQEAIDKAPSDPKYVENPALVYEYQGFKVIDVVRLGRVKEGVEEAEKLYEEYLLSDEGESLRQKDYSTWAIWRSGLLINLCRTIMDLDLTEQYKQKILVWLDRAEQNLKAPEGVVSWTDFGFRKNEISKIRAAL
jgi:tetratricopeptide (TPR) repeat protein